MTIIKDIRNRFLDVRDQGERPTCTAFALSDAHSAERPPHKSLSTEYLFHHAAAATQNHRSDQGITVQAGLSILKQTGQPIEAAWPYSKSFPSIPLSFSSINTPLFKASGTSCQATVADIRALLYADQAAVIVIEVTKALFSIGDLGLVKRSPHDVSTQATHAVVAVALGEDAAEAPHILIRNSWGHLWGLRGYAWLSEDYLVPLLKSVTSVHSLA